MGRGSGGRGGSPPSIFSIQAEGWGEPQRGTHPRATVQEMEFGDEGGTEVPQLAFAAVNNQWDPYPRWPQASVSAVGAPLGSKGQGTIKLEKVCWLVRGGGDEIVPVNVQASSSRPD